MTEVKDAWFSVTIGSGLIAGAPKGTESDAGVKLKAQCCRKYERKAKACKGCPVMAVLSKSKRRKRLRRIRKDLRKAA